MKKAKRFVSFLILSAMLLVTVPFSGTAYGASDGRLVITHINESNSYEGAGIIIDGAAYSTLGQKGNFAYWKVAVFDWDDNEEIYKVSALYLNNNNFDKSSVAIPDDGFAYGVCIGNDYPTLYKNSGNASYKDKPNYTNAPATDSCNFLDKVHVGDKAYLYDTDLANGIIKNNGKNWYAEDYVSESFIKIGDPIEGMTAYDPNNGDLISFEIHPNGIVGANGAVNYAEKTSAIVTPAFGDNANYGGNASFDWWYSVVFDYDFDAECYVVKSLSRQAGNGLPKQPIIPKNGFVLVDCYAHFPEINNLKIGSQCWLHDIDLASAKLGASPTISVNAPKDGAVAYKPATAERLDAPKIKEANAKNIIDSSASGITVTWDAVAGASGYTVSLNNGSAVTDGALLVRPTAVSGTSYTVPSSVLSVGGSYTLRVIANGNGKADSTFETYTIKAVSDTALKSSLRDKTIVAFGDSLTARTGYVSMLYGYIGTEVINSGVGGDTTNQGKSRFKADVLDKNPDIVLICFGMNDQAYQTAYKSPIVSLEKYRENLEYFAKTLIDGGSDVIFITPNPVCTEKGYYVADSLNYAFGLMPDYCNVMREVAEEYDCGLIDINFEFSLRDLKPLINAGDGIHQSTAGHELYAKLISDYLLAVYDNNDKATATVECVADGKTLKTYTLVGKAGSNVIASTPDIEGYTTADKDVEIKSLKNGEKITFNYTAVGSNAYKLGDVNGDGNINAVDYIMAKRAVIGTYKLSAEQLARADVNKNGGVDAVDYIMIKRHVIGTYTIV